MAGFESLGLKGGIWQGVLSRTDAPGRILLVHMAARVGEARVAPDEAEGRWRISAALPLERLSDGVQTFLLVEDGGAGTEPLRPGGQQLASLTLVAGDLLEDDLRAELNLMRAELDLLKKEFRRLAAASPV